MLQTQFFMQDLYKKIAFNAKITSTQIEVLYRAIPSLFFLSKIKTLKFMIGNILWQYLKL